MTRRDLLTVFMFAFLVVGPAQAQVAVKDVASIYQQALGYAKQGQQLLTEAATLQASLNSYAQLVRSGLTLPQAIYANVRSDINQVRSLANAASLLTGNSGSILTRLSSAQGYANQAAFVPQNIGSQITTWQQTLANANLTLGRTLGVQQGQESNYVAIQAGIQAHSTTAAGQMQAIQAGNESLGLVNTQLQQLQTTLVASAQQIATRDEISADRQAVSDAAKQSFLQSTPMPTTGAQY